MDFLHIFLNWFSADLDLVADLVDKLNRSGVRKHVLLDWVDTWNLPLVNSRNMSRPRLITAMAHRMCVFVREQADVSLALAQLYPELFHVIGFPLRM